MPLHDFRSSDTPVVSEGNARKIVANQIDLICVPQLTSAEGRLAAQNGGYRVSRDRRAVTVGNELQCPGGRSDV